MTNYLKHDFNGVITFEPTYENFARNVLSIISPTKEVHRAASDFTHLKIDDTPVPLPYIREKIPEYYRSLFLDDKSSTHILRVAAKTYESEEVPVHDLVLISQCLRIRLVAQLEAHHKDGKPVLIINEVPHGSSFGILLEWLYSNDEQALKTMLERAGIENLLGFAWNCRFLGIINPRVVEVVRTVLYHKQ